MRSGANEKTHERSSSGDTRGGDFGPAQFECHAATVTWTLFRERSIVERALLYSMVRSSTRVVPLEGRFAWACNEPFNELASYAHLQSSLAQEILSELKQAGVVLNGEDGCILVVPPNLHLHRDLDEDLGLRMAYAWCFETPLEPEERAVMGMMCWNDRWDFREVAAASRRLGIAESRVQEISSMLGDRLEELSAEAERRAGGASSTTPEARMCRSLIEFVHRQEIQPLWLDIEPPPGWTRADRVSNTVAYRLTDSDLVAIVYEATDASQVHWRMMHLFFPDELTANMLLKAGTAFLGHGSHARIGGGFLDLEKATGTNCFLLQTTKPLGSLTCGDVILLEEEIHAWGQWMRREFDRRRAVSLPS